VDFGFGLGGGLGAGGGGALLSKVVMTGKFDLQRCLLGRLAYSGFCACDVLHSVVSVLSVVFWEVSWFSALLHCAEGLSD